MRALLLAGGKGTRLRPFTEALPKCMMPIHGRPLLDIWLEELFKTKIISKVLVNVSYKKEIVPKGKSEKTIRLNQKNKPRWKKKKHYGKN